MRKVVEKLNKFDVNSYFSILDEDKKALPSCPFYSRVCFADFKNIDPKEKYVKLGIPYNACPYSEEEVLEYHKRLKPFGWKVKYLGVESIKIGSQNKEFYIFLLNSDSFKSADDRFMCMVAYRYLYHNNLNMIPKAFMSKPSYPSAYDNLLEAEKSSTYGGHRIVVYKEYKIFKTRKEFLKSISKKVKNKRNTSFTGCEKHFIK